MDFNAELTGLARRVMAEVEIPPVIGLYLPAAVETEEYRDEFGFVYLADGTAAPFYVSLADTLAQLWRRFPRPQDTRPTLTECLQGWGSSQLAERAMALGAFNAIGQYLMRVAGFRPPARIRGTAFEVAAGAPVGMVGYFCPLVDQLLEQGFEVLVLEQQPARVAPRAGVTCTERVADLSDCSRVICTASTLVNDSLDNVLSHCNGVDRFELIGPSGSGLPDIFFEAGVDAVGGVSFENAAMLNAALARQESWGSVGYKYELTPDAYPGVEALLSAARSRI